MELKAYVNLEIEKTFKVEDKEYTRRYVICVPDKAPYIEIKEVLMEAIETLMYDAAMKQAQSTPPIVEEEAVKPEVVQPEVVE